MSQLLTAALLAGASALGLFGWPTRSLDLKCPEQPDADPDMPYLVIMVDEQVVDVPPAEWDQRDYDIEHMELVCSYDIEAALRPEARAAVLFVLTRGWAEEQLVQLVAAQDARHRAEGVYATWVGEPAGYEAPRFLKMHVWGTDQGWAALTEHDIWGKTCYVFAGTPPSEWERFRPDTSSFREREPVCLSARTSRRANSMASSGEASPGLKCTPRPGGDPDMPQVVAIVDGVVTMGDLADAGVDQADIDYVEIVCWSWVEKTFGVRVRQGGVLVMTTSFDAQVEASLTDLLAAQDEYASITGSFASLLTHLERYDPPPLTRVYLRKTQDGWAARTQHAFIDDVCYVFSGTLPSDWNVTLIEPIELEERRPICVSGQSRTGERRGAW